MKSWVEYWNSDHPIYVSERHKRVHAAAVGQDILRQIHTSDAVVLDHGCGEALYAEAVAAGCAKLFLCEAAPAVRQKLASRVAGIPAIEVIDADAVAALEDASLDLVVANSLAQYLTSAQLIGLLDLWRRKLKPNGSLVIADVVPPNVSPITDAAALLRLGWQGGFLGAALAGLVKTALSDYRRVRATLGFATYSEAEFLALLRANRFEGRRIRPNFGHNQARMAFRATPAP